MKNLFTQAFVTNHLKLNLSFNLISDKVEYGDLSYTDLVEEKGSASCAFCSIETKTLSNHVYYLLHEIKAPELNENLFIDMDDVSSEPDIEDLKANRIPCCLVCYSQIRLEKALPGLELLFFPELKNYDRTALMSYALYSERSFQDQLDQLKSFSEGKLGTTDPLLLYKYLSNTNEFKTIQAYNRRWIKARQRLINSYEQILSENLFNMTKRVSFLNKGVYSNDGNYFSEDELKKLKINKERYYTRINARDKNFVKRQLLRNSLKETFDFIAIKQDTLVSKSNEKIISREKLHGILYTEAISTKNLSEDKLKKLYETHLADRLSELEEKVLSGTRLLAQSKVEVMQNIQIISRYKEFIRQSVDELNQAKSSLNDIANVLAELKHANVNVQNIQVLDERSKTISNKLSELEEPMSRQAKYWGISNDASEESIREVDSMNTDLIDAQAELVYLKGEIEAYANQYSLLSNIVFNVNRLLYLLGDEPTRIFLQDFNELTNKLGTLAQSGLVVSVKESAYILLSDNYTSNMITSFLHSIKSLTAMLIDTQFSEEDQEACNTFIDNHLVNDCDFITQLALRGSYSGACENIINRIDRCIKDMDDVQVLDILECLKSLLTQLRDDDYEVEYTWFTPEYFEEFLTRHKVMRMSTVYQEKINSMLERVYLLPTGNTSSLVKLKKRLLA